MSLEPRNSRAFIAFVHQKPDAVVAQICDAPPTNYKIVFRCEKCKARGRLGILNCFQCGAPSAESMKIFNVALSDNGIEARGLFTLLLSLINPSRLECAIRDNGASTVIEMRLVKPLSMVAIAIITTVWAVFVYYCFQAGIEWLHSAILLVVLVLLPTMLFGLRQHQLSELRKFCTVYLQELFGNKLRIERKPDQFD